VDNLVRNQIDEFGVIVFVATTVIAFTIGMIVYNKRDIAT
jgi:ABC-type transport system involved in multi-copper enzyme maturation permease subunit